MSLNAQQFHDALEKVEYDDLANTKMYVEIAGAHLEIVGMRHANNGGAILLKIDEVSLHHARERIGEYQNIVHGDRRD